MTRMDWIVVWLLNELAGLVGLIAFFHFVVPWLVALYVRTL